MHDASASVHAKLTTTHCGAGAGGGGGGGIQMHAQAAHRPGGSLVLLFSDTTAALNGIHAAGPLGGSPICHERPVYMQTMSLGLEPTWR